MTFHLQIIVCNARVIDGGYTQRVNIGAGAAVCSPVHTARIGKAKRSLVKPAAGITCRNCDNHAAADDFIAQEGAPDIVVANAGVSSGTLTERAEDLEAIKRIFATNVIGMAATFSPFIAAMRAKAADGRIAARLVGIASVAGIRGLPGAEAYCASKSAVITYLESLRVELRNAGIRVVTIAPGYIATPMTAVNSYRMPFLLPADVAARRMLRAIDRGTSYTVVPWQMGIVAKLLRLLPNAVYDALLAHAPHKPRVL